VDWGSRRIPVSSSSWSKDICSLDKVVASNNWFGESMVRKVGNGSSTFFWHSNWINDAPLSIKFPRLYSLSNHRDSKVEEFSVRDDLVVDGLSLGVGPYFNGKPTS
jgi:hypothetical protein